MLSRLSQNTAPLPPLAGGEDGNTARLSHSSADSCKLGAATKSGGQLNQKVGRRASGTAVLGGFFWGGQSENKKGAKKGKTPDVLFS